MLSLAIHVKGSVRNSELYGMCFVWVRHVIVGHPYAKGSVRNGELRAVWGVDGCVRACICMYAPGRVSLWVERVYVCVCHVRRGRGQFGS